MAIDWVCPDCGGGPTPGRATHKCNVYVTGTSDPGYRLNAGKDRYDLLPAKALHELVQVYGFGAGKYSDRNWEKGLGYMATVASLLRHVFAFVRGQDNDPESGLHHMAHAAFNCLALVEFHYTGKGKDDRPYKAPPDDRPYKAPPSDMGCL